MEQLMVGWKVLKMAFQMVGQMVGKMEKLKAGKKVVSMVSRMAQQKADLSVEMKEELWAGLKDEMRDYYLVETKASQLVDLKVASKGI